MKRIALFILSLSLLTGVYSQGIDCANSEPFCTGLGNYNFPASTNVPDMGSVGCLYTTPNPAWYYMQISSPGNLDIHISSGGDVDFICWGPFSSLAAACATNLMSNPGLDCSYSTAAQEDCNITGAQAGQVYVLLITNYANIVTNISFVQTGGSASTNCGIVAPPITGDTVCQGQTIQLTVNNPTAGASYSWTGPNGFTSNVMNPTIPSATPSMSGTYSMTITVGTQTSPPVTCNVIVNPNPTISITPANPSTCIGVPVNLTGNSNGPLTTYVWSNGLTTNPAAMNPPSTTTYTVTGTDANGCSGTASTTLTVNPNLILVVSPSAPAICIGGTADLTVSGANNYIWAASPDLSCDTCANTQASPLTTTTYSVTGTDLNGCSGSTTVTVTTVPGPNMVIQQTKEIICRGDTCLLTVNGASNCTWSPMNGLSSSSGNAVIASPMATTTYTVTGDNMGCIGTGEVTVAVQTIPEVNFDANIKEGCETLRVNFSDLTHPGITQWLWNFGDGSSMNLSNYDQNPVHLFEHPGTYDITLTGVSSAGCISSTTIPQMIVIYKNPVADFIYNPMVTDVLDQFVWFNEECVNAVSWDWNFGENYYLGNTSNLPNPTHEYDGEGTYTITLAVASEYGCVDTVRKQVVIEPLITFYVANSFTPNGDGLNDVFVTYGEGIDESTFQMRIFDRWGQEVFFSPDINRGWDGRYGSQDKVSPFGVYTYIINFLDVKGNYHKYSGTIDLYR